jgi:hypothetical protein
MAVMKEKKHTLLLFGCAISALVNANVVGA